jgi:hypothetical protein
MEEGGRDGFFSKEWHDKLYMQTLYTCNRNVQHIVVIQKSIKKINRVLSSRRTATWPAAAGTSEFLSHLPQKVL